jgi:hypothetical protein
VFGDQATTVQAEVPIRQLGAGNLGDMPSVQGIPQIATRALSAIGAGCAQGPRGDQPRAIG